MLLFRYTTRALTRPTHHFESSSLVLVGELSQRRCVATTKRLAKESHALKRVVQSDQEIRSAVSAATWLASDPAKVQPSDVLEQLASLENSPASAVHTAVFIATPSLTHWFDEASNFLAKAVQNLHDGPLMRSGLTTFQTISAIVDRIPSGSQLTDRIPASNVGYEGISVLFSSRPIRSRRADAISTAYSPQHAHVRFVSYPSEHELQLIALPVANTLFRNGLQSSCFEDIWQLNDAHGSSGCFERVRRVPLNSFDVDTSNLQSCHYVDMPMEPLTGPQEIVSSMGNVLREVKRHETQEIVPASTDLEAAVPRFLKLPWLTDIAKRNFSVFALTAGKDFYVGSSKRVITGKCAPQRRWLLMQLLTGRARMHRVTGGGGGWGNKKGLLSLEPGNNILSEEDEQQTVVPQLDEDYSFESASGLVSPGDTVQFFAIFPGPQHPQTEQSVVEENIWKNRIEADLAKLDASKSRSPQITIGTNPPEEQYPGTKKLSVPPGDKLLFIPDCFGMLSEGGACLGYGKTGVASEDGAVSFTSRLDIPYSTFVFQAAAEPETPDDVEIRHFQP